jgi:hypothetical protein
MGLNVQTTSPINTPSENAIRGRETTTKKERKLDMAKSNSSDKRAYPRVRLTSSEKTVLVERLLAEQDGKCFLCSIKFGEVGSFGAIRTRCLDHNHRTGKPRKLLCNGCNSILANFENYSVIEYLMGHKKRKIHELENDVYILSEIKQYIETGSCTPHIIKDDNWPDHDRAVRGYPHIKNETILLNDLAHKSEDNWQFVKSYMANAIVECLELVLKKEREG